MYMCVYIQFKSIMYAIGLYKQTQQIIIFSMRGNCLIATN